MSFIIVTIAIKAVVYFWIRSLGLIYYLNLNCGTDSLFIEPMEYIYYQDYQFVFSDKIAGSGI